jgi:hypothetical protein
MFLKVGDLVSFIGGRGPLKNNNQFGIVIKQTPNWTWVRWSDGVVERHSFSVLRKLNVPER